MSEQTNGLDLSVNSLQEGGNDMYESLADLNGENVLSDAFKMKQTNLVLQNKQKDIQLIHTILKNDTGNNGRDPEYEALLHTILSKTDQQIIKEPAKQDTGVDVGPFCIGGLFIILFTVYIVCLEKRKKKRKAENNDHVDDIG